MTNYRNPQFTESGCIDCEVEHPQFGWIPATLSPDDPPTADLFAEIVASGDVTPAPVPNLDAEKAKQLRKLNDDYVAAIRPLIKSCPEVEREGWGEQKAEAQAYQAWIDAGSAGDPPATPTLDYILAGRNGEDGTETLAELVGKVLANVARFQAAQELTGKRHRLEKRIEQAKSVEEVQAVVWESLAG